MEAGNKRLGTALLRRQTAEELLTGQPSREWKDDLQPLVSELNKRPPQSRLCSRTFGSKQATTHSPLLHIGDRVRVALEEPRDVNGNPLHGRFRAADSRYSTAVHTIRDIWLLPHQPPMYWVGQFKHRFIREKLLPVTASTGPSWSLARGKQYIVDRLIRRRVEKGKVEYLTVWQGYPLDQATWEPRASLLKQVPDILKRDEPALRPH